MLINKVTFWNDIGKEAYMFKKIKSWWMEVLRFLRYVAYLDMRALDDPAWLTGRTPSPETIKMIADAKRHAGIK